MTRRGFALAAVLFALVLLAALTAAGFFAALQEARAGRNAASLLRAQTAATTALWAAVVAWDPRTMNAVPVGATASPPVAARPGVAVLLEARRLAPRLFLLEATATAGDATRSVGTVVRLKGLEVEPRAAARARAVDPSLTSPFDGVDQAPAGWSCPATRDTIPALIAQPGATDSVFLRFGYRDWAAIVVWATSIGPGGDSLTVRYEVGNLSLDATKSLGVVIVEGDLVLSGGAEIVGIVIVRGALILQGSGGTVFGALVASQVVGASGYTSSLPVAVYSSCAVLAAGLSRALPEVLPGLPAVTFY